MSRARVNWLIFGAVLVAGLVALNLRASRKMNAPDPPPPSTPAEWRVECTLSATRTPGGVEAQVAIHNQSTRTLHLLRENLPSDAIPTKNLLEIDRDGVPVPYQGRTVKRGPTTAADLLPCAPAGTVKATIALAGAYDLRPSGRYRLRYRTFNPQPDNRGLVEIASNTVWLAD